MFVALCRKNCAPPELAKFSECILEQMRCVSTADSVEVDLEEDVTVGRLLLSRHTDSDKTPVRLVHPPFCPMRRLKQSLPVDEWSALEFPYQQLPATVSVLLQVLLTRRAQSLRAFPGVWVPPGGYVDPGESLDQAAKRELMEETGIDASNVQGEPLGIWESVFPATLEQGRPKRHCLVVYFLLRHAQSAAALSPAIRLSKEEADLALWADQRLCRAIVAGEAEAELPKDVAAVDADGEKVRHPTRLLLQRLPVDAKASAQPSPDTDGGKPLERVSTGTRFALEQWLERLR